MSKFAQWSDKSNKLQSAINWAKNKDKIDSQDNKPYSLVVRQPHREMLQYCGQSYAGANNYHAMPESLLPYLEKALKQQGKELIAAAVSLMADDVNQLAIDSEDEVNSMVQQIEAAKRLTQK